MPDIAQPRPAFEAVVLAMNGITCTSNQGENSFGTKAGESS